MTFPTLFYAALAGCGGGLVRGIVGYIKHQYAYKYKKFHVAYFLWMVTLSAIVGLIVGIFANHDYRLSFVAGYAGGDFLEGLYKIARQKSKI